MKSIRRGLWDGEIEKDACGRFSCWVCSQSLTTRTDATEGTGDADEGRGEGHGGPGGTDYRPTVRACPKCGRKWESK